MKTENTNSKRIEWKIDIPIFRHPLILKQLGIAIGIPFGTLIILLIIFTQEIRYLIYALLLIGLTFLGTYLTIILAYQGKYKVGFIIDDTQLRCYTQKKQAKKNKIINSLAIILGMFSSKYSVSGAGMLAQSRQDTRIKWKNVKKVTYHPKKHFIHIKGNFADNMTVFCTQENYDQIASIISAKTK
jgi:hypothetical protein